MIMSKKVKVLLITSLCLNMLLLGTFIGMEGKRFYHGHFNNPQFAKEMKEFRDASKEDRMKLRREKRKAIEMLVYGPYNKLSYMAQISKINLLQSSMYRDMAFTLAEKVQKIPANERQNHLKLFEKAFGYRHKR